MTEIQRLHDWIYSENREPAQTKFTAGELRNVAQKFEMMEKVVNDARAILEDEKKQSMAKFFKEADHIFESKKERFEGLHDAFYDGWFCGLSKLINRFESIIGLRVDV